MSEDVCVDDGNEVISALLSLDHLPASLACFEELGRLGVSEETFVDPRQRRVYACAVALMRQGVVCNAPAVARALTGGPAAAEFQPEGVAAYVNAVLARSGTLQNVAFYAGRLRANQLSRGLLELLNESRNLGSAYCLSDLGSAEAWLNDVSRKIVALAGKARRTTDWPRAIGDSSAALRELVGTGRDGQQGVLTGYAGLDRLLDGFKPSTLNILAARPSVGKTALAVNIAENVARRGGAVLFVSLEMDAPSLARRLLAKIAEIDPDEVRLRYERGLVAPAERDGMAARLEAAERTLAALPLVVEDACPRDSAALEMCVRRHLARRDDIALVIVDYLQLVRCRGYGPRDRTNEIGAISSAFKEMAKEFRLPFLVLSQLSRANESDERAPQLSDLRGSGEIEQDADTVILLSRQKALATADSADLPRPVRVNVAKHRNGRTGELTMGFVSKWTRYTEDAVFAPAPAPSPSGRFRGKSF